MTNPSLDQDGGWRPIATIPREGRFLVASYEPTSWAYNVHTVQMHADYPEVILRLWLKHAVAWRPMPPEPPTWWRDLPGWGYGPEQKTKED